LEVIVEVPEEQPLLHKGILTHNTGVTVGSNS
jgi:hypothetical protein